MRGSFLRWPVVRARLLLLVGLVPCAPVAGCAWLLEAPASGWRPAVSAPRSARSIYDYPWVWTDERGQAVRLSRWRGEQLVVTLAYTSCRETCPRTIRKLRDLYARFLSERRAAEFVVVTLDPRNDTPERLRRFKESEQLPRAWHFLVGSPSATQALRELLDIHVVDMESHLVHDGSIVLFDATGRPAGSFTGWNLDQETQLF